jgi:hypothetical protein
MGSVVYLSVKNDTKYALDDNVPNRISLGRVLCARQALRPRHRSGHKDLLEALLDGRLSRRTP